MNGTCYPRNELDAVTVEILQAVAGGPRPNILECGGKTVNTGYRLWGGTRFLACIPQAFPRIKWSSQVTVHYPRIIRAF